MASKTPPCTRTHQSCTKHHHAHTHTHPSESRMSLEVEKEMRSWKERSRFWGSNRLVQFVADMPLGVEAQGGQPCLSVPRKARRRRHVESDGFGAEVTSACRQVFRWWWQRWVWWWGSWRGRACRRCLCRRGEAVIQAGWAGWSHPIQRPAWNTTHKRAPPSSARFGPAHVRVATLFFLSFLYLLFPFSFLLLFYFLNPKIFRISWIWKLFSYF